MKQDREQDRGAAVAANSIPSWAAGDRIDDEIVTLLGSLPSRWGRMTPLSRVLIVAVGRLLQSKGLVDTGRRCTDCGLTVGLIGGTRRGSLHTDLAFLETMGSGQGLASPALFGYTLPNIPLAEAAGHYGLVGPVYALVDPDNPFGAAVEEARRLLQNDAGLSLLIAGEFDHYREPGGDEKLQVNLKIIDRDADSYPDLPEME